jgi:type VI secretion system protein ImpM
VTRTDCAAGFYGKLPSHGDFLSRRLPRQFIEPWDHWLQRSLAASREQLGRDWLETYLISPIWQFALAPGACGNDAWAGVMMPSVDRVGRYFPLTVAAKVNDCPLTQLFDPSCGWFEVLSKLALSSLDYDFDLQAFDEQLERMLLSDFLQVQPSQTGQTDKHISTSRLAFQFQLDSNLDTPQAFAELGEKLSNRFLANCCYWRSTAMEDSKATSLLLCEGLPPTDAYVGFLNGTWSQRGWQFSSSRFIGYSSAQTVNSLLHDISYQSDSSNHNGKNDAIIGNTTVKQHIDKALKWQSYGLTVVGQRRKLNEDAILERSDAGMWAVADGMGGHSAGDVASQALVSALAQIQPIDNLELYSQQVVNCLKIVNRDLLQIAQKMGDGQK